MINGIFIYCFADLVYLLFTQINKLMLVVAGSSLCKFSDVKNSSNPF